MDPSDLLPGLATMLEERIRPRPLGRYMANLMVLAAWSLIMLSPLLFLALIAAGVSSIFEWEPLVFGGAGWGRVLVSLGSWTIGVCLVFAFSRWLGRRFEKRADIVLAKVRQDRAAAKKYRADAEQLMTRIENTLEELRRRSGYDCDDSRV